MNRYEKVVADFFLSSYDKNMSFREILVSIEESSDLVLLFEPFFHLNPDTVIGLMEDLLSDLYSNFLTREIVENDLEQALLRN